MYFTEQKGRFIIEASFNPVFFNMHLLNFLIACLALMAPALLLSYAIWQLRTKKPIRPAQAWQQFRTLSIISTLACLLCLPAVWLIVPSSASQPLWIVEGWLGLTRFSVVFGLLVQGLGLVIGTFSARYLQGESRQLHYIGWLAAVLGSVQLLVVTQHWLVLIASWAAVGLAMQRLLCFYEERPFARLAAQKKHLADRVADLLLISAAALAWYEVGQGSFFAIEQHLAQTTAGPALQVSAIALVLAVIIRTALFPAHGWLTQVMEAPTPVSALLHAGVVNLGGFILIQLAPLLEAVPAARWILIIMGLATALLAGLVILTRISIKVRLAWSTIAQMGFMVLECGLGLYTLAALHLIGHSLYKAHAFLRASSIVRDTSIQRMQVTRQFTPASMLIAPFLSLLLTITLLSLLTTVIHGQALPIWWSALLALAWAPLFWIPLSSNSHASGGLSAGSWRLFSASVLVSALCLLVGLGHMIPMGLVDLPHTSGGWVSMLAMAIFYSILTCIQICPAHLESLRRWSYAGFYVDEFYTRLTLRLWPGRWVTTQNSGPLTRNPWLREDQKHPSTP